MFIDMGLVTLNPIFQLKMVKMEKFKWPSQRELPEDLKNHITFDPSDIFGGLWPLSLFSLAAG